MDDDTCNRRAFLRRLGRFGAAGLGAGALLPACGGERQPSPPAGHTADDCTDVSGLTQEQLGRRQGLGYVDDSPHPENLCDNCQFWLPAAAGERCGGCVIVPGPIDPKGYCNSWAPQTRA